MKLKCTKLPKAFALYNHVITLVIKPCPAIILCLSVCMEKKLNIV